MADYLRNTLFIEDLLEFLFSLEGIKWEAKNGVHSFRHKLGKSPFQPVTGWAVDKLCAVFHEHIKESYSMLSVEGIIDKAAYSKYALQEASNCFCDGYTPERFIAYCVHVLGVPGIFSYPSIDILDEASQVVVLVLFSHQMTGEFYKQGGWSGLTEVSSKIVDRVEYDETNHK